MSDNLSKIEIQILDDIYKKDYENNLDLKISIDLLPLNETNNDFKVKEAGYYLERLKRLNYLQFKEKALLRGGGDESKYNNNIHMIWWEDIYITYKGKRFIEEVRKSNWARVKESSKEFIKDIGKEMRSKIISHLASFILGIIVSYLYYLIFIR